MNTSREVLAKGLLLLTTAKQGCPGSGRVDLDILWRRRCGRSRSHGCNLTFDEFVETLFNILLCRTGECVRNCYDDGLGGDFDSGVLISSGGVWYMVCCRWREKRERSSSVDQLAASAFRS